MTRYRKYSRFQLLVSLSALVAASVLLLIPATRTAYLAGFGILGLLGVGEILFNRKGSPLEDERDEAIQRKATTAGFTMLWLGLVGWSLLALFVFSSNGTVPIGVVKPLVPLVWCLMTLTQATWALVLDGRSV